MGGVSINHHTLASDTWEARGFRLGKGVSGAAGVGGGVQGGGGAYASIIGRQVRMWIPRK